MLPWIFLGALFATSAGIEVFTTARYPIAAMGIRLRFGLPAAFPDCDRETASSTTHA